MDTEIGLELDDWCIGPDLLSDTDARTQSPIYILPKATRYPSNCSDVQHLIELVRNSYKDDWAFIFFEKVQCHGDLQWLISMTLCMVSYKKLVQ